MTTQAPCARCGKMFEQRHRHHAYCGQFCQAMDDLSRAKNDVKRSSGQTAPSGNPPSPEPQTTASAAPKGGEGQS
jgi:endogenous inhibitor of DNA gyrase (YacG/DUF329 family)